MSASGLRDVHPAEDCPPRGAVANPVSNAGIVVNIVKLRAEVRLADEALAVHVQLHAGPERLPTWVINSHHLIARVDVQIADIHSVGLKAAKFLEKRLSESTDDFSARAAKSYDQVITL